MSKKVVYVTGCLGFIGNHVTRYCLNEGYYVYGIDKGTYAANAEYLHEFMQNPRFRFDNIDINHIERLVDCDYVINTAAESHVDNSIVSSEAFLKSNFNGVWHLLELIRMKRNHTMPVMLHFSTDEVYGDIVEGSHSEQDLLKPSNPYSATKAAADMLVLAWARTYQIPYVIVRPTNNYGIGQYVEKLIPKTVKALSLGNKIELHDHGKPRRTWLHVEDTARAVMHIIKSGTINEIYNISGNFETENIDVVTRIIQQIHSTHDVESYIKNIKRAGQDVRYSIDDTKLKNLGWNCASNFDTELHDTVEFYMNNFIW